MKITKQPTKFEIFDIIKFMGITQTLNQYPQTPKYWIEEYIEASSPSKYIAEFMIRELREYG